MNENVLDFRKRPLQDLSLARELRKGSRGHPIDLSHPLSREKLVDISEYGIAGENYYHKDSGNPPYNGRISGSIPHLLLRQSVARRLFVVNERLRRSGLEIFVYDAYRPVDVQDTFYLEWMPNDVRKRHPEWGDARVLEEVCKFWGRGSDEDGKVNPLSPPFHSTGGAVDCTLRDRMNGELLPMGCGFDDFHETERSSTDHIESLKRQGKLLTLDEEFALGNRRILYWALVEEWFVNNPNEVWHFDLYDQLWAALREEEAAFYSIAFVSFLD
jgi:D-alanyl-D-alanine dipeptidase